MQYRSTVFVVTEEQACPVYSLGDEFRVREMMLSISRGKPACLSLLTAMMPLVSLDPQVGKAARAKLSRGKHECGGCQGIIRFEPKKSGDFATLQMKLLIAAERREKFFTEDSGFAELRGLDAFSDLDDEQLHAICNLGRVRQYSPDASIVIRGEDTDRLFILLSGRVQLSVPGQPSTEIGPGALFGELSLVTDTIYTADYRALEAAALLVLTVKELKTFLGKYPALHVFFYRRLAKRLENRVSHLAGHSASLSGSLKDVMMVDLFQLINSSQKSGRVELYLQDGSPGEVLFSDGELVRARHSERRGKEAFFSLLACDEGSFSFITGLTAEEKNLPVIGGFMSLVMEGMQKLDEQDS